ncbi:hypothetical protein BGZ51_003786 [Haplosporangium sp. Z 767]|nr:hypothetical protein BGZ51_003786 [Haplosporangium sp. Z 767]KAF9193773.1 hypothetical protein BGZ50_007066 [Haplosporangium sp. Z 11]
MASNRSVHSALPTLLATLFEGAPFIRQNVDQMRNDEHFRSFFETDNGTKKLLSDECFASDGDGGRKDYILDYKPKSPVKDEYEVQRTPDRIINVSRRGAYCSFVSPTPSSDILDSEDMKYDDEEEIDCDEQETDPN